MSRLMGLDVGDKTIGSCSDLLMITAQGVKTIKERILKMI